MEVFEVEKNRIKKMLTFLGYFPRKPTLNFRMYLIHCVIFTMIVNSSFDAICNWGDFKDRLNGLKCLTEFIMFGLNLTVYAFKWDEISMLLKAMETYPYRFSGRISEARQKHMDTTRCRMSRNSRVLFKLILLQTISSLFVPLVSSLVVIAVKGLANVSVHDLVLAQKVYFPEGYTNVSAYILAYFVLGVYVISTGIFGYLFIVLSITGMKIVEEELNLLRLSVENFHETISCLMPEEYEENYSEGLSEMKTRFSTREDLGLRLFLRYFVRHHQFIYEKVGEVNKGVQWLTFIGNFGASVYVCLAIGNLAKSKVSFYTFSYALNCLLWSLSIFVFAYFGERIATADENLRTAVYECPWLNKVKWFRSSIYIILTRMNVPVEIKPVGIFKLNLKNFSVWANAAYSYYNVLKNFSS